MVPTKRRDGSTITQPHCQQCGSTDPDDVLRSEGRTRDYSVCCNEGVMVGGDCTDHYCDHD